MQVYRGMDIGTAKPSPAERARVPHHLVDIAEPEEPFTVAQFQTLGVAVLERLTASETPVLVVGGSGLHFRALVDPLRFPGTDPAVRARFEALAPADAVAMLAALDDGAAEHVDLDNPRRVVRALEVHALTGETPSGRAASPSGRAVREYRSRVPVAVVGLDPGDALPDRVAGRLERMMAAGLLDEVAALAGRLGPTAAQAAGYRQLLPVVRGEQPLAGGVRRALDATTGLAHRQRVFFRRDPRITWIEWHDEAARRAEAALRVLEEARWTS
jgi:tRNA dimethylallyltransferase